MAIDVNKYLECRNPVDPLALYPEGALQRLVDGFCFYLKAGVSILYPKAASPNPVLCVGDPDSQFGRLEPSRGREWYHAFCAKFRNWDVNDRECRAFDAEVAAKYWIDPKRPHEKYECHMGLIEMSYPLRLGNRIVAVVFAGQLIPQDQASTISRRIDERAEPSTRVELHERLSMVKAYLELSSEDVDRVFENFVAFGNMLQGLLDRLYAQQWEAAKRGFLNDVVRELTLEPSQEQWHTTLDNVLQDFLQLMGLAGVKVYRRRQSRFELWGQAPKRSGSTKENIPARLVAVIPDSVLTPLERLRDYGPAREDLELLEKELALGQRHVQLFAHRYRGELTPAIDILLAISGTIAEQDSEFIRSFCETVALRVRVAALVLTLQDERADFEERVGHVGHTAKLPLQMAVQELDDLMKLDSIGSQPRESMNKCLRYIRIAKTYIREIYTAPTLRGRPAELRQLLEQVVTQTRELTRQRGCQVNVDAPELYNPSVRDQGNLEIVFTNLLDNATMYSDPGGVVSVRLGKWGEDTAAVEIENVGQGIPPSHIDLVREGHNRWVPPNLPDTLRRRRDGEGLGLSMAIQYVEGHGGWVDISSKPEEEQYQNDTRSHWRTRVTVGFPVVKERAE